MSKVINAQLVNVENANLSNYNKETNTYFIPRKYDIKVEEDKCYVIHLKPAAFKNDAVATNWNNNQYPTLEYMKVDISKKMGKMIKVVGVQVDYSRRELLNEFWSGWLHLSDVDILEAL